MTDRIMRWLDESQRLADQATEGPWSSLKDTRLDGMPVYRIGSNETGEDIGSVPRYRHSDDGEEDAEFIAESRTRLPQAVAALRAVMELHQPSPYSYPDGSAPCRECNRSDGTGLAPTWWPCPTLRAVTEALGLEGDNDAD